MIRKNFDLVGSKSISDKFKYYRRINQKPDFINDEAYKELKAYWSSPELLSKSIKNKKNRASDCGGKGPANHTGGSIPRSEHDRRMNKFAKKLDYVQTSKNCETIPISPNVELKTWAETVCIGKKGNIYGLGSEAARVRPILSSRYFRPSSSVDAELASRIQTLEQNVQEKTQVEQSQNEDYEQIKEKLAKTEELYAAFKEQLAKSQERIDNVERLVEGLLKKRKKSKPPMYPAKKQQLSESESDADKDEDDEESSD